MIIGFITALVLAFLPGRAQAGDKVSYPVQEFQLTNVHDIRVVGVKGNIRIRQSRHQGSQRNSMLLVVSHSKARKYDDWYLSVQRRGHTLFLEVFNTNYGAGWRHQVRQDQWPEFDLDITSAARPMAISWREGFISADGWKDKMEVSFLKGQASLRDMQGDTSLQVVDGQVDVSGQRGPLRIKGDTGQVKLTDLKAALQLNWLSGSIECLGCQGHGQIESTDSKLKLERTAGDWTVQLDRGTGEIKGFDGKLQARGVSSNWNVTAAQGADVSVIAENGSVVMTRQPGRSKIFLTSMVGPIKAPAGFKKEVKGGIQVVQSLEAKAGTTKLGQVFVRTRSGAIQLW